MKKIILFVLLLSLSLVPKVFADPLYDSIRESFPPNISSSNEYARMGYLDCEYYASQNGYTVDPTGVSDSTAGLQACLNAGYTYQLTSLLPTNGGIYKVSNTLTCDQANGGAVYYGNRYGFKHAHNLVGKSSGARPTIFLANSSSGFNNPSSPKAVIFADDTVSGTPSGFDQQIADINISIGTGNSGAIGLQWKGAQGTNARNIKVDMSNGGFACFYPENKTDPQVNLEAIGGQYGIYHAAGTHTVVGFKATGQTVASVRHAQGPFNLIGFHLVPASGGIGINSATGSLHDSLNLIDGVIEVSSGTSPAINNTTGIALYARQVWVNNTGGILKSGGETTVASSGYGKWDKIVEYNYVSRKTMSSSGYTWTGAGIVNTTKSQTTYSNISNDVNAPDVNSIWTIHIPPPIPWFQDDGVVNVIDDGGAVGDGMTEDTAAFQAVDDYDKVFIPRGTYLLKAKITFTSSNAKVFGVSGFYSEMGNCRLDENGRASDASIWSCWEPTSNTHMLATSNNVDGTATFANLKFAPGAITSASHVGCVDWQHGRNSETISLYLVTPYAVNREATSYDRKMLYIHGNGGGRHYNSLGHFLIPTTNPNCTDNDDFRSVYVYNTSEPTTLYMPNPEHTQVGSNPEMEARNSGYVRVLGIKTEAFGRPFAMTNVTHAMIIGMDIHTGGKPWEGFFDCTNFVGTSFPRSNAYFVTSGVGVNIGRYSAGVLQSPYLTGLEDGFFKYGNFDDSAFGTISDEENNPSGPNLADFAAEWNMESGALLVDDQGHQNLSNPYSIASETPSGTESILPSNFGNWGTAFLNGTTQYFSAPYTNLPWQTGEPAATVITGIKTNSTIPSTLTYLGGRYDSPGDERTIGLTVTPPGLLFGKAASTGGDDYDTILMSSNVVADSAYVIVHKFNDTDGAYAVEVYDTGAGQWWTPLIGNWTEGLYLAGLSDWRIGARYGGGYFNGKIYFQHVYSVALDQTTYRTMVVNGPIPGAGGVMTDWYWSDCDTHLEITSNDVQFNQQSVCFQTVWSQPQVANGQRSNLGTPFTMDDSSVVYASPTAWGQQTDTWEWRLDITPSMESKGGLKLDTISGMVNNLVSGTTTIENANGDEVDYDFTDLEPDTKMVVIGPPKFYVIPKQY